MKLLLPALLCFVCGLRAASQPQSGVKSIPVSGIFCGKKPLYVAERVFKDGVDYYTLTSQPNDVTLILTTNERATDMHRHMLVYGRDTMSLSILYGTRDYLEFEVRRLAFGRGTHRVNLEACATPRWRKEAPVVLKNFPCDCSARKQQVD